MGNRLAVWLFLVFLLKSAAIAAQTYEERLLIVANQAKDLEFPTEPSELSSSSVPGMALYKPEGMGPFPALVLQHGCSGLGNARWRNITMLNWAREAVRRGYVTLVIDSLGPRGVDSVCMGAKGGVSVIRGGRDALQAAEHLRKLGYVDKNRVAFAGFSWGATIGVLASGKQWGTALSAGERFAAVVAFYPSCYTVKSAITGNVVELVTADIDRPLLSLLGDKDTEAPAPQCVARLGTLRDAGAPVQWHVYPGATHCWDCEDLNGNSKIDARGNRVVYTFDKSTTQDSAQRMFEFFQKHLPAQP